jgi:hypothetical protein
MSVLLTGSAARLSSFIRGYHAHASWYSKPIKRCFLSGVKEGDGGDQPEPPKLFHFGRGNNSIVSFLL